MNIDLREELRKRDELLDGYLKQIECSTYTLLAYPIFSISEIYVVSALCEAFIFPVRIPLTFSSTQNLGLKTLINLKNSMISVFLLSMIPYWVGPATENPWQGGPPSIISTPENFSAISSSEKL